MGALVHITRTAFHGHDVYGHTIDKCDPAGCAGNEAYFPDLHDCVAGEIVDSVLDASPRRYEDGTLVPTGENGGAK